MMMTGPLPWQAMLIGEEKDPDKVQQMLGQQSSSDAADVASLSFSASPPQGNAHMCTEAAGADDASATTEGTT